MNEKTFAARFVKINQHWLYEYHDGEIVREMMFCEQTGKPIPVPKLSIQGRAMERICRTLLQMQEDVGGNWSPKDHARLALKILRMRWPQIGRLP